MRFLTNLLLLLAMPGSAQANTQTIATQTIDTQTINTHTKATQTIAVANSEDFALVLNDRWLIASTMPGGLVAQGALTAINTHSKKLLPLATDNWQENHIDYPCSAPVPPESFSPHGIASQTDTSGQQWLYVVNHGQRESIEIYSVTDSLTPDTPNPQLQWRGCLELHAGAFGNAVAATPDGSIWLTNMGARLDGQAKSDRWMGEVIRWQRQTGWQSVPGSDIYAVNGLLVSDDQNTLFVNSWAAGEIIKLSRTNKAQPFIRTTLTLDFLPDNLRWGPDKNLIAAGLDGTVADVVACMQSTECSQGPTSQVAIINAHDFTRKCSQKLPYKMVTSAIYTNGQLWLGSVRGNHVWAITHNRQTESLCPLNLD